MAGITFRVALVVIGLALALVLAWELRQLITLAFLAALLAAALQSPSGALESRGLPRVPAVLLTYLVLLSALALVVFLIFPPLVQQAVSFVENLPELFGRLRQSVTDLIAGLAGPDAADRAISSITAGARSILPQLTGLLTLPLTVLGILVNVVLIIVLSGLMLLERDAVERWVEQFVDRDDRRLFRDVSHRAFGKLGSYVRGQLLLMTSIGLGAGLGMVLIGFFTIGEPLQFLFPLSLLAFITEAIPMVGPYIGGVPIIIVAFLENPLAGILMAAWLVALQQLEGFVLVPIVQGKAVSLSPMVVLLAVLAGGSLAGIVGAIIAIPIVAVADVVIRDVVFPLRQARQERVSGSP